MMRKIGAACVVSIAGLALVAACHDDPTVPDLNNVSAEQLKGGLNRSSLQLLVTGLLNQDRAGVDVRYLVFAETMARDLYRLDPAEGRFITELVGVPADPGGFVGGGVWTQFFISIRTANTILDAIDNAAGVSAAEKSATKGLVRTIKALNYYRAVEMRDSIGVPIDVNRAIDAAPAPLVCKPKVLAFISLLLDEAYTDLQAGGSAFPFTLPAGFTLKGSFDTPSTFAKFNRGLKGKAELYRGLDHQSPDAAAFDRAITALNQSFVSLTAGTLDQGVYYTFSTAPGETVNPLSDAAIHLNPAVCDSIQAGDARATKIVRNVGPYSGSGVTTTCNATVAVPSSENLVRPIALMKNSELILLRAQAEIERGSAADFVAATNDINFVRQNEGGLPPIPVITSKDAGRSAVLYEKRYSLLFESGHRLADLRAYGRLKATFLKKETANDVFQTALPIPQAEKNARSGDVTVSCT